MSRRFDEQEVELILREATQLERVSESGSGSVLPSDMGHGLTLEELKEIASEAGIDPSRVDQAARSLLVRPRRSPFQVFLGTAARVKIQSDFETQLDETHLAAVLSEVRSLMSVQGTASSPPGGLEWASEDEIGGRYVTVVRTPTGTRMEVTGDFENAARGAAGVGAVVAGAGAVGVVATVASVGALGWALAPVVAAAVVLVPRLTAGRIVSRESRRLTRVASRLRSLLSAHSPDDDSGEKA